MELASYEKEHIDRLKGLLPECTVLLKNDADFRVDKPCKVALFGSGARNTLKGGTGSGDVNSKYYVTVEEAFEEAGFEIVTKAWMDEYDLVRKDAKRAFVKSIRAEAKSKHVNPILYGMGMIMPEPEYDIDISADADLAVYVLSRICGEGNDRKPILGDFLFTQSEIRDILALNEQYEKFVLVLNVGGPVDLSPVNDINNILILSQLGVDTGTTLVDIISKRAYPSGKLSTTWSSWNDYCSKGDFGNWEDTVYKEGIYVGYRYFDTANIKPMYPFGFGLSFAKTDISVENVYVEETNLKIEVLVKNVGSRFDANEEPTKEVTQVYITQPETELNQPFQVLAGFAKTSEIKVGESDIVSIDIDLKSIASFDTNKAAYVLEKGDYIVRVGNSSDNTSVVAVLKLDKTVIVRQVKNLLGPIKVKDTVISRLEQCMQYDEKTVPIINLDADAFLTNVVKYDKKLKIHETVAKLRTEQLISLSVGYYNPNGGLASIIGEASQNVCGAAGETSSVAVEDGLPALIMADGPAGIRIAKDYYEDDKGLHNTSNAILEDLIDVLGPGVSKAIKNIIGKTPKDAKIKHQYATAIPIGTAIAQSFNTQLAYTCGDIVGDEMTRFGVHLWLAPALNIHRSVLCGRNFEYYSEDPLLSGEMAAAITNGVQSHKGCGTTIKHYAANNQETNRYNNNSVVSERAMREIYLKGFEICIRKSQPVALMTSYNLINGTHASERRDLNEDILRSEFEYDGFVMTDWVVAAMKAGKRDKYMSPVAHLVSNSGNDVFMPGSRNEVMELTFAYKNGLITRSQLETNISRLAYAADRLLK